MKMSDISINEKSWCYCALLPTFIIGRNDKFELEVGKNKHVISFPFKFTNP